MSHSVYWIRHPDHTDMFSQGYIGVSNNFNGRLKAHKRRAGERSLHFQNAIKKYGWDNLIKTQLVIGTADYCYLLENKLRSTQDIGWNIQPGGDRNASIKGKKRSKETCKKISVAKLGVKYNGNHALQIDSSRVKGANNPRALKVEFQGLIYGAISELAVFLNIKTSTIRRRIKCNSKKWGYKLLDK
ncbi:hypothetical protein UFOVP1640_10 [uncultured Caudovirales phage]|uniref:GIY-YIG domain-containing protein n=1 Tax=uncultured Caudovirales phage TaxID=2100421 RepID=A0A6J5RDP1_9CAUD|nr:hypothetical protein UFOVP1286_13 [uncultured Caudovirales phage]CAB4205552.1 hypothetical protein UFOVP1407_43 [uncultured Caudovirales phage]CAB4221609.1 hypothetical protein UFOVP1640_10 [uncultured Caudovirales phage]